VIREKRVVSSRIINFPVGSQGMKITDKNSLFFFFSPKVIRDDLELKITDKNTLFFFLSQSYEENDPSKGQSKNEEHNPQ